MRSWRSVPALVLGLSLGSAACTPDQGNVNEDPMNTPRDLSAAAPADLNGGMTTECAAVEVSARQAPAALLVLLDRSSSMADGNKWAAAAQAIVQAIDQDAFDNMTIGLMAAPSGTVKGPQCVFNLQVSCVAPPFPQVDLQAAGTLKSTAATGVRRDIRSWLQSNTPDTNPLGDASPLYAAAVNALTALQGWPQEGKRILLTVTDGTLSCGQLANRPGFPDCNGCTRDWEDPANLVKLFDTAKKDSQKPVDSFLVGVPGADSFDAMGCNFPPYHMRLALSAIGYAGSPENAPAGCTGKTFTQAGADPAVSCHFDMTQGGFSAAALASVIGQIRGKLLGCVYDLPQVDGGVVERGQVNLTYTVNGTKTPAVRRKNPSDTCLDRACWDYNAAGKIELIGKSCEDVKKNSDVQVRIGVGCATVVG